ncbi:hypothetical protein [Variovorax paradoxus]|uniref:hypothetical protein n=1 Tax=Variovorax paradoxus TaxID=34073 RepID=UPI003ECD851E
MPKARTSALTFAPVSPKVAKLLHQLYAEAAKDIAPSPTPAGVALLEPPGKRHVNFGCGGSAMYVYDDATYVRLSTIYRSHGDGRPAPYWGHEDRHDEQGRIWSRDFRGIVDDFGDLQEVVTQ